jgi:hypothetical protein
MDEFTEGRYLCYGDRIIFEISDLEGCDLGGVLGVQELKYSNEFLNLGAHPGKFFNNNKKITVAQQFSENSNDVTRKRNFGFSAISEKNGIFQAPSNFFLNSIFGIVAGVGFEAEGEPVYYGSQVKLALTSTREYLFAGFEQIDFMRKEEFEKHRLKECNFKIRPRHGVRSDGEKVFYNDLIVLVDYKGRELLPLSKSKIVLRTNVQHNHGLRIGLYLSSHDISPTAVEAGDVVQLFHKVGSSYLVASPTVEDFRQVNLAAHPVVDKKFLENSVSLWQIESVPYGERRLKVDGTVYQRTAFRLRHIMSDKLLRYQDGAFALIEYSELEKLPCKDNDDPTLFEFRVNLDALHEEETLGFSNLRITFESFVRIFHIASQSYVILRKDAKSSVKKFSTAQSSFDRDVFQIFPVSSKLLEIVLTAKRLKLGMSLILEKLNLPNQPKFERIALLQMASKFFALCVGENSFLAKQEQSKSSNAPSASVGVEDTPEIDLEVRSVSHLIANEFGFVEVLLQIAQKGFQSTGNNTNAKLSEAEELLAKSAYTGLATLLKMDSSSVHAVIKCGGVLQMIRHFLIVHPQLKWNPPLMEYADAVSQESISTNTNILVFNEEEIKLLLDKVYSQLIAGEVPTTFTYRLLAKACYGNANLFTNRLNGMNINKRMQMMIAEQLMGSPHSTVVTPPHWSMMFYRTILEELPEHKSDNGPVLYSYKMEKEDFFGTNSSHTEYTKRFRLRVTTSLVGQIRPFSTTGKLIVTSLSIFRN